MSDEKASPIACLAFKAAMGLTQPDGELMIEDRDTAIAEAIGAAFDAIVRDALEKWPHTAPEDLLRGWLGEGVPSQPAGTIRRREFTDGSNPFYTAAAEIQQCEYPDHPEFCAKAEKIIRALFDRLRGTEPEDAEALRLINKLREDEGACVTIPCDNPDPGPLPNNRVIVSDAWTGWDGRVFEGESLLDALKAAVDAKDRA